MNDYNTIGSTDIVNYLSKLNKILDPSDRLLGRSAINQPKTLSNTAYTDHRDHPWVIKKKELKHYDNMRLAEQIYQRLQNETGRKRLIPHSFIFPYHQ